MRLGGVSFKPGRCERDTPQPLAPSDCIRCHPRFSARSHSFLVQKRAGRHRTVACGFPWALANHTRHEATGDVSCFARRACHEGGTGSRMPNNTLILMRQPRTAQQYSSAYYSALASTGVRCMHVRYSIRGHPTSKLLKLLKDYCMYGY